jgi:26S proteasome regulatory subunit T2
MPPAEGQNQNQENKEKKETKDQKKKWEPPLPTRVGRKKKKRGPDAASKLPAVFPTTRCRLKLLKMERIKDYLLLEEEFVQNQERLKPEATREEKNEEDRTKVDDLRGTPMAVGTLEEIIDDDHAIISTASGPEFYVSIMSFVDKDLLEPNCQVLLHHKTQGIVGVLADDADPMVSVMKLDKAPTESYADIGGLEQQIQEIKVCCVARFLLHDIYYRYRNLSSCLSPTPNFTRRWVSSHRKVSSCTVYLGQERPCWRKPSQTKRLRRSFALSDQS